MSTAVQSAPSIPEASGKDRAYYWPESGRVVAPVTPDETPADATPLPEPGEFVNLNGAALGDWIGLVEPVTGPQVTVRLHRHGEVSAHSVQIESLHADRVVVGTADAPVKAALEALSKAYETADREKQQHEWWKESLVEDAHEWANSNDLCSRFDEFMSDHNLPPRSFDHRAEVEVTLRLPLWIGGHDDDHVRDQVDRELVTDGLTDPSSFELVSFQVVNVERD